MIAAAWLAVSFISDTWIFFNGWDSNTFKALQISWSWNEY